MGKLYFKDSEFYREVYDWYRIVFRHYLALGMKRSEARMAAYDSIEARFNIRYSWARKIINGESRIMKKMSESEKASLAVGVRDKVLNMVGNFENDPRTFGKILPKNARDKLKIALGEQRAEELIRLADNDTGFMLIFNEILKNKQMPFSFFPNLYSHKMVPLFSNIFSSPYIREEQTE